MLSLVLDFRYPVFKEQLPPSYGRRLIFPQVPSRFDR